MRKHAVIKGALLAGAALLAGVVLAYVILRAQVLDFDTAAANTGKGSESEATLGGPAVEFVGYSDSLDKLNFEDAKVGGLSALGYDPRRDLYYALVDRKQGFPARFYTLRLPVEDAGLGAPEVFDATSLQGPDGEPFTAGRFDGEGIAFAPWGDLLVASEVGPSIRLSSLDGRFLQELPMPSKFRVVPEGLAQSNGAFEGLSLSPSGDVLFAALQKALVSDNRVPEKRQRIRLLRYENQGAKGFQPSGELFYATETEGGIADIVALSETELLVLERPNEVFYVDLDAARDFTDTETLADLEPPEKKLVAAIDDCVPEKADNAGSLPNTYEGMALGPSLSSGRRVLMLVSDDNFDDTQTTRVVALSIRPERLADEEREACR